MVCIFKILTTYIQYEVNAELGLGNLERLLQARLPRQKLSQLHH